MKRSISSCVAILLTSSAPAQEPPRALSPLVVEATRGSVVPPHFAGNATVIDEETIANAGARSLADLLTAQGGVRVSSFSGEASGGEVSLRGFGENSSSRVLILVDGQAMNRPDMAGVSLLEIPVARIAQIEILRGSQTARFGDQAVGGVINIITKEPGKPRTSVEVAGGSNGYALSRIAHSANYGGNRISVDAERNFSDGWRDNAASELESAALRWNHDLEGEAELRAGAAWAEQFTGFPGPLSEEEYRDNPRQSLYTEADQADQYFSRQTSRRGDAGLLLGKNGPASLDLPVAFSSRDQQWNLGPGSHTDNLLETWIFSPVTRISKERWTAELGFQLRRDTLTLDQYEQIERTNRIGEAGLTREDRGIFTSGSIEPWDGWHFSAAARWQKTKLEAASQNLIFPEDETLNFASGNTESNRAVQLGIRWEPSPEVSTWLRYDRLYRLPSTDEIASYQGFPLTVPFNDELRAEKGSNIELGGEFTAAGWTLRAGGFLQKLQGEILYDYNENLNINADDTRRAGGDLDLGYQGKGWEGNLHFTRLKATFTEGDYQGKEVYLVPRSEVSATLAFHPHEQLTVQAEYQVTSASYEGNDFANDQEKLPGHRLANLLLRYEPRPGFSIYVKVNNLLDEQYAAIKYSGVFYPGAGRTFQCGVRSEF